MKNQLKKFLEQRENEKWITTVLNQRILETTELQSNRNTHRWPVMLRHGDTPPEREGEIGERQTRDRELGF